MSQIPWQQILGWGQKELTDLRAVAYAYVQQGSYQTALTIFEALNILSPSDPYDLQTVGAIYLQMGNGLKALEFLDRALKLEPSHLPTLLNRAKALFLLGYRKQGLMQLANIENCLDPKISSQAFALRISYS